MSLSCAFRALFSFRYSFILSRMNFSRAICLKVLKSLYRAFGRSSSETLDPGAPGAYREGSSCDVT